MIITDVPALRKVIERTSAICRFCTAHVKFLAFWTASLDVRAYGDECLQSRDSLVCILVLGYGKAGINP
jgi:hypothetical protein